MKTVLASLALLLAAPQAHAAYIDFDEQIGTGPSYTVPFYEEQDARLSTQSGEPIRWVEVGPGGTGAVSQINTAPFPAFRLSFLTETVDYLRVDLGYFGPALPDIFLRALDADGALIAEVDNRYGFSGLYDVDSLELSASGIASAIFGSRDNSRAEPLKVDGIAFRRDAVTDIPAPGAAWLLLLGAGLLGLRTSRR